eukprot:3496182-Amphidinium_carterae.1
MEGLFLSEETQHLQRADSLHPLAVPQRAEASAVYQKLPFETSGVASGRSHLNAEGVTDRECPPPPKKYQKEGCWH